MAERSVRVRFVADVASYQQAVRQAAASTVQFGRDITSNTHQANAALETMGRAAFLAGGAIATGLALATKSAVDWETAFAGVAKTVSGTEAELASLEEGLRRMASELPATHQEIAAVAEAAGALGVETSAIEGFTRTMIDLGETTDLTADQAATALARLANIMQTAPGDFDRLGSALVDLGNNGASTEAEIVEMAQRLAAAGQIAGLSEADVLGFASALASVGVDAEAGGTALSKVFTSVRDAVLDGGEALETFAGVAGMSTDAFADLFRQDAAGAISSFVDGLGAMSAAGRSTTGIFDSLELADQRLMRSLLSLAGSGGLLTEQLEVGNDAWRENTALSEEAEKRYATTGAQLEVLRNQLVDVGIQLADVMLPILNGVASVLGTLASGFGELPGPLQTAVTAFAALSGSGLLVAAAFAKLYPTVVALKASLTAMGPAGAAAAGALGPLAAAAAVAGAAVVGLSYVMGEQAEEARKAEDRLRAYADAMREAGSFSGGVRSSMEELLTSSSEFRRAADAAGLSLDDLVAGISGTDAEFEAFRSAMLAGADAIGASEEATLALAGGLAQEREAAQGGAQALRELERAGVDLGDGTEDAARGVGTLTAAMLASTGAADASEEAFDRFLEQLRGSMDPLFGMVDAARGVDDAQRRVSDAQRDGRSAARDLADAQAEVAEALAITADRAQAARDGISDLAAAEQARINPLLGMLDALAQVQDAQDALREANATGEGIGGAQLDTVRAAAALEQASIALVGAVRTGDLSVEGATATLREWVAPGLVTAATADAIATRFDAAAGAAEGMEGANVDAATATAVAAAEQEAAVERAEALAEAQDRVVDAQYRVAEAQMTAARAQEDAARAALDYQIAAAELNRAISDGTVDVDEARRMLDRWVDQGLITQGQAETLAGRFDELAQRADELDGSHVIELDLDTSGFEDGWDVLQRFLADNPLQPTIGPAIPLGDIPQFFASGGVVRGKSGRDRVPAMLTAGEGVLNRRAMAGLSGSDLDALNSGTPIAQLVDAGGMIPAMLRAVVGAQSAPLVGEFNLHNHGDADDGAARSLRELRRFQMVSTR